MIETPAGTNAPIWTPNDWTWRRSPSKDDVWVFTNNRDLRVLAVAQETDIGTWEVLDGVHGGRIAHYETLSASKLGVEKFNLEMRK